MSRPRIYGHVDLRPVQIGLVDPFARGDALIAAVALAAAHWGGARYLLLPYPLSGRAVEFSRNLGLDALACVPGSGLESFTPPAEFEYRSFPRSAPFEQGDGSLHHHVLPMSALSADSEGMEWSRVPSVDLVAWEQEHPLALVLSVLHGHLPTGAVGPGVPDVPITRSQRNLGSSGALPSSVYDTGLLARTMAGVRYRGPDSYKGIVCVDAASVADLVGFWNLRATGADVVLWPAGHGSLASAYFDAWWSTRVRDSSPETIHVWTRTGSLPTDLIERLADQTERLFIEELSPVPSWAYAVPCESHYNERFDVEFDPDAWYVDVPLPKFDLLPRASWYETFGVVTAEIEVSTEADLAPGRGSSVPMRRDLGTDLLRHRTSPMLAHFSRPVEGGLIAGVEVRSDKIALPIMASAEVVAQLFNAAGLRIKRSDAGLYVDKIIEMLGGVAQDGVALQPAIRDVLAFAARAPYGRPAQALVQRARESQGEWPQSFWYSNRDYPTWVVHWLSDKRFLRAVLKSRCTSCGNTLAIAAEDIDEEVACALCGERRPLALHLTALRPEWRLALHRHILPERIAETFPVMAALSIIGGLHGHSGAFSHHVVGVQVSGAVECEVDLVVATYDRMAPVVILGECKSFRDAISDDDVANLGAVQRALAKQGIESYVLYATLRDEFTSEERAAIRASMSPIASTLSFRPRAAIEPIPPIVLDGRVLSLHSFDEGSLLHGPTAPRSLSELAAKSCRHSIGLSGLMLDAGSEPTWAPTWADTRP